MNTVLSDLPLDGLFVRLQRQGFQFGVDTHLQVQTLLQEEGQAVLRDHNKLKFLLAAVIAKSQEQQQTFYRVFDAYWEDVQTEAVRQIGQGRGDSEDDHRLDEVKRWRTLGNVAPYVVGLLGIITLLILTRAGKKPYEFPETYVEIRGVDSVYLIDQDEDSILGISAKLAKPYEWRLVQTDTATPWPKGAEVIWAYGGGVTDTVRSVDSFLAPRQQIFQQPGDYRIQVIMRYPRESIRGKPNLPEERRNYTVDVHVPLVPRIRMEDSTSNLRVGDEVAFQALVGDSVAPNSYTYKWDLGDGREYPYVKGEIRPQVQKKGTFTVSLIVGRKEPTGTASLDVGEAYLPITVEDSTPPCTDSLRVTDVTLNPERPVEGRDVYLQVEMEQEERPSAFTYIWQFGNETDTLSSLSNLVHRFRRAGDYLVKLHVIRKTPTGESCKDSARLIKPVRVASANPKTKLVANLYPLREDFNGYETFRLTRASIVLLAVLITSLLLALGLLIRYGTYRPPNVDKTGFDPQQEGPFLIPFPSQDHLIAPEKGLYQLAAVMRQRRRGTIQRLNLSVSIQRTIAEQGMPILHFDTSSRPAEYLILIDQISTESHLARLYDRIMTILKEEDVLLTVFFYDGDPRHCWNDEYPEGISWERLTQNFRKHRLLIFTPGDGMIDPYESLLYSWVPQTFAPWNNQRIMLTPKPVVDWGYQEETLATLFGILPLDILGQLQMANWFGKEEELSFAEHHQRLLVELADIPSVETHDLHTLAGLQAYVSPEVLRWVAATTVYTQPVWEVTLAMGHALSQATEDQEADYLLTYENLLTLARIPWLQTGNVSDELRARLFDLLDVKTEALARATLLKLLAKITLRPNSLARHKHTIQETTHEFFLRPGDEGIAAKMYELVRQGRLSDPVQQRQITQASRLLDGQRAQTYLDQRFGVMRPKEYVIGGVLGLVLAVGLGFGLFTAYGRYQDGRQTLPTWLHLNQERWIAKDFTQDEAVEVHNRGVTLWSSDSLEQVPDTLQRAIALREDQYPLADSNLNRIWYQLGALAYNDTAHERALQVFERIDSLGGREVYLRALGGQALSLYYLKQPDRAKETFSKLVQIDSVFGRDNYPNLYTILLETESIFPEVPDPENPSMLVAGQTLMSGQGLISEDSSHYLILQKDGNLVIYNRDQEQVWEAGISIAGVGGRLTVQTDGNAVYYDQNGKPIWASDTHPYFDYKYSSSEWRPVKAVLENGGVLALYSATGKQVWTNEGSTPIETYTSKTHTLLLAGQEMSQREQLVSSNGEYYLTISAEGSLGIYKSNGGIVWSAELEKKGVAVRLAMQTDGNLVCYDQGNDPVWATETHPYFDPKYSNADWKPTRAVVEDDGTLALYSATGRNVWTTAKDDKSQQPSPNIGFADNFPDADLSVISSQDDFDKLAEVERFGKGGTRTPFVILYAYSWDYLQTLSDSELSREKKQVKNLQTIPSRLDGLIRVAVIDEALTPDLWNALYIKQAGSTVILRGSQVLERESNIKDKDDGTEGLLRSLLGRY